MNHLARQFNSNQLREHLQYLTPGFTPEIANDVSRYKLGREKASQHINLLKSSAISILEYGDEDFALRYMAVEQGVAPNAALDWSSGKIDISHPLER